MNSSNRKVCVAFSGGVDSSVATAILLERGYDCFGVFIISCDNAVRTGEKAKTIAGELGIELCILDLRNDFERILKYFCDEYKRARTPNPCVYCNRLIKFGKLFDFAKHRQANYLATGHYAKVKVSEGRAKLYAAATVKDQSYMLAMINPDVLEHLLLPAGDYSKEQIRKKAEDLNLSSADSAESQEICFIPDDDYISVLEQRCPEVIRPGRIVDSQGSILDEHNGVHRFTIGQRRGLGVAMGEPYYVVGLDAETNTVTLGPLKELTCSRLSASGVNWLINQPTEPFRAMVKIRYNEGCAAATVEPEKNHVEIEFDEPVSAITPGQLAVFYITDGDDMLVSGGGWIDRALS